jgi:tetratricopeptide (TPR) repeat protein
MAYARMGAVYGNLGERRLAEENAQKAFDLHDRTSEREKFYIADHYYRDATGELDKDIEDLELWIQTYPRDFSPRNNIAVEYSTVGEFQKALAQALEALRLQPHDILPYTNVVASYIRLNQLEEAKAIYKQALEKKMDTLGIHSQRFTIAYLEGDSQEMERQAVWASGKTQESSILLQESQVAASRGQLKKARELSQQAFDSAKKFGLQSAAALAAAGRGIFENWLGDPSLARTWSTQALELSQDQMVWAAAALALAGDSARPEKVIDTEGKRHPKDTDLQQDWIPQVRAAIAIKSSNPAAAVEALKSSGLLEPSDIGPTFYRGLAYLDMKSGKEAAAEFKKIMDRRTIQAVSPLHPLSQLHLARSLSLTGDTAGARTAYQDFFAQWKDADPDLPLLKQAKGEYAKLQ